nr:hypothetical protein [Tanacetum cinerariifolium]
MSQLHRERLFPNHPTSPITPPIIVPPSLMLSLMFNPQEFFLPEELLLPKKRGRDRSSSSTFALPQEFKIRESSHKTSLERQEEQIKEILNHLDELSLDLIKNIEGLGKGRMSRDVLTIGSTMRISLLYRGEYSQWVERFMNYLEEQTDGEAMIICIKNGDQPLPRVTQVSIAGTLSTEQPSLKDKSMCNKTAKDLWDALARHMLGSEYGEQDRKAAVLYEYETFKATKGIFLNNLQPEWKQYATTMRQNKKLMDINIDALYNILKQNQGDVDDAMGLNKKTIMVTSDPLALIAEKTKAFDQRKFYSKPTKNNLRTSSTSQSANKKQEFVKTDYKKLEKKDDEKMRDMSKVKCYNCKKEGQFAKDCKKVKVKDYEYYKTKMLLAKKDKYELVLLAEDQAWMESSSDSDQEINANMVFMTQIEKVLSDLKTSSSSADDMISEVSYYLSESESESEYETSEYYDNTTTYGLFVNDNDDQEIFHDCEIFSENLIESQINHNESAVDHNDSEGIDKYFENQNKDLQDKYDVLKNQATTFEMKNIELNEQLKVLIEKNNDLLAQTKVLKDQLQVKHVVIDTPVECQEKYAKLEAERYEYMIRYSTYFDNDKQHMKQIADQEVLYDKMSVQLVELDKHLRDLKNTILEKDFKIYELEECVRNKDLEIEKCLERLNICENKLHKMGQTNQTVHMIMPSKDTLYNGRKGIALEIEKFKRSSKNKIKFAYDYGSLNASYVNEKINFSDDYFQEIINPDFKKIDSPFQQTSSLKPYVTTVILEKIIIDLEDEVVSLLEKEKSKLETIESLKSKGFESSENTISKSENQSENDCQVVEKECDQVESSKVIAPGMFKLNVSQIVSPISMSKTSCASKNVENKTKRKRRKRKSSKQSDKQVNNDVSHAYRDFVHFSDLDNLVVLEDLSKAVLFERRKGRLILLMLICLLLVIQN